MSSLDNVINTFQNLSINNLSINNLYINNLSINNLSINNLSINNDLLLKIIKIQKWFRGCILRLKQLPLILYKIQNCLKNQNIKFSFQHKDGRINSCIDEEKIIDILIKKFNKKIKKSNIRSWYDILVYDYIYGWLPVNIKITTTLTNDNIGNLATCVYAYTDEVLDLYNNKKYNNGNMSVLLLNKLKNKKYNIYNKKDYYFIVLNKNNYNDIIVNSIKGITYLKSNLNNLPFQVCWNKNRHFNYTNIRKKIKLFIDCLKKPDINWKETFICNIRKINL